MTKILESVQDEQLWLELEKDAKEIWGRSN